jgi:hypothetical protein
MSGPIVSPSLTSCAEVIMGSPKGELSTRLDVDPYAHLPAG